MHILYEILMVPVVAALFWWWTFGGGKKNQATYWRCSANHDHRTPAAARRCSAGQPPGPRSR